MKPRKSRCQMAFRVESIGPFSVLTSEALSFVTHGFIGKSSDFSERAIIDAEKNFKETFNVRKLFLPTQVHGSAVIDLREGNRGVLEGDAVIVSRRAKGLAIGVRTADCVPIILSSGDSFAVIHAGWRGLAAGIIQETVKRVTASHSSLAIIGPAAGFERYEVGAEVIDALGVSSVHSKLEGGKFLLSLEGTARRILESVLPSQAKVVASSICTISSSDFHSYRRDREHRGSNLGFIIP